jgi:hypothetical protein
MELGNNSPGSRSSGTILAPMRSDTSYMIKFCLNRAAECRRGAEVATDPSRKQSWLKMEGQWFFLARSYDNERRARLTEPFQVRRIIQPVRFDQRS